MIQSIHIPDIGAVMMKKSLYLFSLLCLIGAPLAHDEVYFLIGLWIQPYARIRKTKHTLISLPNNRRKFCCNGISSANQLYRVRL